MYKNKKKSQDAHEAIRPTSLDLPPEAVKPYLKKEELRPLHPDLEQVHRLPDEPGRGRGNRFHHQADRCEFKAKGEVIRFNGYFVVYPSLDKETATAAQGPEG